MNDIIDIEARNSAVASRKNVIVTAGAGTGKTTILIDKLIHLLTAERIPLEEIVALTFTEKAANEIKIKLLEKLMKLRSTSSEQITGLINTAIGKLAMSHIGTIHSFCAHILRLFPIEAGVSPDFEIDEGNVFESFFEDEWHQWLEKEMVLDSPNKEKWSAILQQLKLSEIKQFTKNICKFTTPMDRMKSDDATISTLLSILVPFASNLRRRFIDTGYVNFDGLLTIARDLLKSNMLVRRELKETFKAILIDEAQDNDPIQVEIILYLAEAKEDNAVDPRSVKSAKGKLFIVGDSKQSIYLFRGADIEAFELMREIIKKNDGEEYNLQTNFRSHSGIVNTANSIFSKLIERNEFIQPEYTPIYAYREKAEHLKSQRVELWYAVADRENGSKDTTLSSDDAREIEAEAIAKFITTSVGKLQILTKNNVTRPLEYRDIAILFRKLTTSNIYTEALKVAGIPYVTQEERAFYRAQEVIDLFSILKAIEDPEDKIALVGVLRSPLTSASDREIYELHRIGCLDCRKDILPSFSADSNVSKMYSLLYKLHNIAGEITPYELIDRILEETLLLEIFATSYYGEQSISNIMKMRSIALELNNNPDITLKSFISLMEKRINELEKEGESPLADETIDAIKLLSIHKAKGLEFPVVIIPDLHGSQRHSSEKGEIKYNWLKDKIGIKVGDLKNSDYDYANNHIKENFSAEEKRILYVAMTRAREMLILTGLHTTKRGTNFITMLRSALSVDSHKISNKERKGKATAVKDISSEDYSKCGIEIRYITEKNLKTLAPSSQAEDTAVANVKTINYREFNTGWRKRAEQYNRILSVPHFTNPTKFLHPPALQSHTHGDTSSDGALIGVICHRVLQLWDFDNATIDNHIKSALKELDAEVQGRIVSIRDALTKLFSAFVNSDIYGEIKSAKILAREVPFIMKYNKSENSTEQIIDGRIDLLYEYGGKTVVADYKTDTITTDRDIDGKIIFYKPRYELYREAVKRSVGIENPVVKLIFLQAISPQEQSQIMVVTL